MKPVTPQQLSRIVQALEEAIVSVFGDVDGIEGASRDGVRGPKPGEARGTIYRTSHHLLTIDTSGVLPSGDRAYASPSEKYNTPWDKWGRVEERVNRVCGMAFHPLYIELHDHETLFVAMDKH